MKAQAAVEIVGPPHVSLQFNAQETQELVQDLGRAMDALSLHASDSTGGAGSLVRLQLLHQVLQHELGHLAHAAVERRPVPDQIIADVAINSLLAPPADAPGTLKGIPLQHLEWALKVYKLTASHSRASEQASLERVFPKGEAEAKEFFQRTQNVWNMRVNGGEAPAFEVQLGVQDARKHKKKGSFREVDRALCTGGIR